MLPEGVFLLTGDKMLGTQGFNDRFEQNPIRIQHSLTINHPTGYRLQGPG